ncbi:helix-turn-helix domain-containing protein [Rhodococcoides fascians]|uniref:helix-turn-helix domain-containing protein n=1 Tax=Rhodococcoides fascians TaxID=1828 RepID=UPI00068EA342|nr:helix-turn-helix transcriptional regulator [Rhodococcus fascians]
MSAAIETSKAIAEDLRAEMGRQQISRVALAKRTGITRTALGTKLNGDVPFTVDEVVVIAGALGISTQELLAKSDSTVSRAAV